MKKITFLLSATALVASCSFEQKPAPYEANSSEFYGRSNSRAYASNDYIGASKKRADSRFSVESENNNTLSPDSPDYNSNIDQQNSKAIVSRPLGQRNQVAETTSSTPTLGGTTEVYSREQDGISSRKLAPIAIDGNEQVVKVGEKQSFAANTPSGKPQIQPKITTAYDLQRQQHEQQMAPVVQEEETIPPVGNKPGFVNIAQANQERKAEDKLSHIKPVEKPKFVEEKEEAPKKIAKAEPVEEKETEQAAEEPTKEEVKEEIKEEVAKKEEEIRKHEAAEIPPVPTKAEVKAAEVAEAPAAKKPITPVIQRVETNNEPSSGAIQKSTVGMMNKQAEADEDDEVIAMPPEKTAAAKPATVTETAKPTAEDKKISEIKPTAPKASPQFIKPVDGVVVSEFGSSKAGGGVNDGITIQAPEGTPVKAANGGTVVYSGNQLQAYGNLIIVRHPNGYLTAYSHLKELELKKGDSVNQGDVLGHVGKTGNVETPQLHFGIRKGREPVDPKDYL